jgi:hypothetical protein
MQDKIIDSFLSKDQAITRVSNNIDNEEKPDHFSELSLIDNSPIILAYFDPKTHQPIKLKVGSEYPLYPILKLIKSCFHEPKTINITFDLIQKAYLDTVNAITNPEKKFLIHNLYQYELLYESLHFILLTLKMHLNSSIMPNLIHLAEINLKLVKLCKKHTIVKRFKADINLSFEGFLGGALEVLISIHHLLKNYELTETYCHQLLDLYPTFKLRYQGVIASRYCFIYGKLSDISLQFGHINSAIKFLLRSFNFIKKPQIDNFVQHLQILAIMCEKIINYCKEHADFLSALKVISLTKTTITALGENLSKLNPDDKKLFLSWNNKFNEGSAQVEKEYFSGLQTAIADSPPTRSLLEKVQYDFKNGQLILFVKMHKDTNALTHLKAALKNLALEIENCAPQIIKVNLYECTPDILKKACTNSFESIKIEKEEREKKHQLQKEKNENDQQEKCEIPACTLSQEIAVNSNLTFFPLPKEKTSARPPVDRHKPYKARKTSRETEPEVRTPKKPSIKITEYHWPNANRNYYANERNQGKVKMFSSEDSLSDIWFGYIHEGLAKEPLYKQWNEKLVNGKLGYHDIRYISKELKRIQHNFSSEHPYKFKIVIPNHDERLYGWVEEVIVDNQGKRHYLVCFGYVDDHKIKSLPNPITQKQLLDRVVEASKDKETSAQITLK